MIRRPPRSTRTVTLFPYTTLFRSPGSQAAASTQATSRSFDAEIYKTPAWQPHRVVPSSPPEEPSMTNAAPTTSTIIPCLRYRDALAAIDWLCRAFGFEKHAVYADGRSEEHTSELQSLMRISYAVF